MTVKGEIESEGRGNTNSQYLGTDLVDWVLQQEKGMKNRQAVITLLTRWLSTNILIPLVYIRPMVHFVDDHTHWYYFKVSLKILFSFGLKSTRGSRAATRLV